MLAARKHFTRRNYNVSKIIFLHYRTAKNNHLQPQKQRQSIKKLKNTLYNKV
ncbi:hypothetical protein HMPREF9151_00915 [Hoylesella saccharolytica F0055]|uniref:Uncharacterized protein n=1 Tax=Hoylesella saccharolytica F0055 TaxID=1127699 RepID=L1NF69_9BACT|nr:hypothetical protein HMPREF9151_00915 [Hoylesella saccharolytica F0055]